MGIFTIKADGRIDEEYSQQLETILDQKNLKDQDACHLLLIQSHLTTDERSQIHSAVVSSIGDDVVAWAQAFPRLFEAATTCQWAYFRFDPTSVGLKVKLPQT